MCKKHFATASVIISDFLAMVKVFMSNLLISFQATPYMKSLY